VARSITQPGIGILDACISVWQRAYGATYFSYSNADPTKALINLSVSRILDGSWCSAALGTSKGWLGLRKSVEASTTVNYSNCRSIPAAGPPRALVIPIVRRVQGCRSAEGGSGDLNAQSCALIEGIKTKTVRRHRRGGCFMVRQLPMNKPDHPH
jgi:hypothetical protein